MGYFQPQNPGLGGLDELTDAEALFVQNIAGLSYAQGDILYHDGSNLVRLAKGTATQVLAINAGATAPEWINAAAGGNVSNTGTPVDNQIAVWTSATILEGTTGLTYDGANLQITGDIGSTGTRITKGWFTDLQVTNAIAGSITGNSATVTNATLTTALTVNTGAVTLTGNVGASTLTLGAGASSISGANTGDQTSIVGITGTVAQFNTAITDATLSGNNTGDNTVCTSGTATTAETLATPRAIYGNNFDGSAALTQIIASTYGGTGNGFTKFTGATTAEKTFTLPDASATLLYSGGDAGTPSALVLTNASGTVTNLTLVTPALGTPASGNLSNCTAAGTAQVGVVELATAVEVDTGTDATRAIPVDQFVASKRNIRWLVFNLVEAATNCAVASNIAGDFVSPIAGTILQSDSTPFYLYATNSTAGTTGNMVVDINIGGTSIMTTNKLSFDSTEKTTTTAATPPDLTTTTIAVGDILTIDIDSLHTTAAKGLTIYLAIRE